MTPDLYEFITEVRQTFTDNLNTFLVSKGMSEVNLLFSGLKISKKPRSLAVYPTSASGSTTGEESDSSIFRFTVDFYCNASATENGLTEVEKYYAYIYAFLTSTCFGEYSSVPDSVLIRMDEQAPFNGCSFLVESRIVTYTDFDDFG
jgi:hypothetical protein